MFFSWDSVDNESSRVLVSSVFNYCGIGASLKLEGAITDSQGSMVYQGFRN